MWIVFKYKNGERLYLSYDNELNAYFTEDENKAYHFNYFDYAILYLKQGCSVEKIY